MKLLIIEDERELSASIVAYLSSENYVCEQAFTCTEALEKIELYDYDCVLLDLMLPGGYGLDILREIRKRQNPVGVIIVSAKDSLDDKVRGWKSERTTISPNRSIWRNSRCASTPSSAGRSLRQITCYAATASKSTCQPSR